MTNRILLALFCTPLLLAGCGVSDTKQIVDPPPPAVNRFADLTFGTDDSFEIVTWNLHNFPSTSLSVEYAAQALRAIDADIVALQEIVSGMRFRALDDSLAAWSGYRATGAPADQNLALLWKDATVTPIGEPYEIFTDEYAAFPRSPLVLECVVAGDTLVVVVNHFKAYDDNIIDYGNPEDDEYRRVMACQLLDAWIRDEHPDTAVIVLGDLNDKLIDPPAYNVFQIWLDASELYRFADMPLATGPSSGWSWRYSGHLDHILVTNELFPAVEAAGAEVRTLRMDSYLENAWTEYETHLSDHLPVALKLPF
ncbi:MAG: endonuclease/exonuclease/phosphatase family protein [Candidatus Latescibacteria bacterium]|nr:endonuclease/exonuclease/phosphatase family protein [Candidatus Latescibacterota bacterium]